MTYNIRGDKNGAAQICSADAPQTSDIRKALAVIAQKGGIGHEAV